jgi:5-methylcytosine-specific restriction endonuclease McrA
MRMPSHPAPSAVYGSPRWAGEVGHGDPQALPRLLPALPAARGSQWCPDCGREYDRRLSREKRARWTRNSAAWQQARAAARARDGNACTACGSTENLQVHHVEPLASGGDEFALSNLTTLFRDCHGRAPVDTARDDVTPVPNSGRNTQQPRAAGGLMASTGPAPSALPLIVAGSAEENCSFKRRVARRSRLWEPCYERRVRGATRGCGD